MSLNVQFIIISILPISFLLLAFLTWRAQSRRRYLYSRWIFTLLIGAVWASSTVRIFTQAVVPQSYLLIWGIIGPYAFTLMTIGLLITTLYQINSSPAEHWLTMTVCFLLWGGALVLEPRLWIILPNNAAIGGQLITQASLWLGVWVASWFTPLLGALILTQRTRTTISQSLVSNLLNYWSLMLFLFLLSSVFNSIQQINQPGWQQLAVLIAIFASVVGTFALTQSHLPDLPLAIRQLVSRLSGFLVLFAFSLFGLYFLVQTIITLPGNVTTVSSNIIFALATLIFTTAFVFLYRIVARLSRRIFLPAVARRRLVMSKYANAIGNLPNPQQLGDLYLQIIQANFGTDEVWFFEAIEGPQGALILRPLTGIGITPPTTPIDLPYSDPIAQTLRYDKAPLVQYDINSLEKFTAVSQEMRQTLANWKRIFFMPLHAGDSLIGVLGIGEKRAGGSYTRLDFQRLAYLTEQMSPLFAQAQNLASLQKINNFVFQENQILAREKRHLKELVSLYHQFFTLLSPDLLKPFHQGIELPNRGEATAVKEIVDAQLNQIKQPFDHLIALSNRIGKRNDFDLKPVHLNEIVETAITNLEKMTNVRRIKVEFEPQPAIPPVLGDGEQLLEAIHHLLHNAIKFNKIGGIVQISSGVEGSQLVLKISDTGVGMSEERQATLWNSLSTFNLGGKGRGTGFSLALTRFIVLAHGGEIEVQTKYGSGSVFILYLPPYLHETNTIQ
jgi:signal transduction histidine kinase